MMVEYTYSAPIRDAFEQAGLCQAFVQFAERVMQGSLASAFYGSDVMTVQGIEAEERAARRATLGRVLRTLRERVDIAPEFDAELAAFLEHRNFFVHELHGHRDYDVNDEEGRKRFLEFVLQLTNEAWRVTLVFMAAQFQFAKWIEETHGDFDRHGLLQDPLVRAVLDAAQVQALFGKRPA